MNLTDTYNQIAENWHKDHLSDDWWNAGVIKFTSLLKPGSNILDVGCGSGLKSKVFLEKGFEVVGFDISAAMIEIAKKNSPNGKFIVLNIDEVDELSGQFDGIFAQAVLLHIPKKEIPSALAKLTNKLKPKGYFYVAVKQANFGTPEEEIKQESDYGYKYERFFSYFTMTELEGFFQDLKLNIVYKAAVSGNNTTWLQIIGQK